MNRIVLRFVVGISAALTLATATPTPGSAQVAPADSAAVLLETAQEFAARGEGDVARALYRYILQRWPDSAAARTAEGRLAAAGSSDPGEGATELQVWSTLYGLFLGVAVPTALGAENSEAFGVGLLLGGPAGFVAGRKAARAHQYTVGQARAITLGGTWGLWQGLGWRQVLDIGEEFRCDIDVCFSGDTAEETATAMILGSAAGLAVGAYLARDPISDGTATGANTGAFWGSWVGFAGGMMFDLDDDGDDLMLATLLAGNAGLATMAFAADDLGWSRSRWRVVSIAGVLGALGGFGIDLIAQPDAEAVIFGIPLLTSAIGMGVGIHATRGDPDAYERGTLGPPADETGSVVGWRDGSWSVGTPTPMPTLLPIDGPRGTEWKPALGVTLFRAVF